MADSVRYGRRKQAYPRRKNVDEEGGEEKTNVTTIENGVEQLDTIATENNENDGGSSSEEQLDNGVEAQTDETDIQETDQQTDQQTDTQTDSDSHEDSCSEKVKSKSSKSKETKMKIDESSNETPETNGNCTENEAESIDSMIGYHDNYENGLSEELKIRELLRRGDTAVIFPEPADEQTDIDDQRHLPYKIIFNNNNNNNDEVGSIDGECLLNCSHCDSNFSKLCSLRDHLSSVHGFHLEKHVCSKCGADFSLKSQLEKHLALHSPTSQVCRVCHKTFANVYRLQRHMISHDESTDLRKFKCPECGKAFKFKHHLKEHIRIHSGEKPFECTNCGKRFSHSGSYSSHMTSKKCWVVNMKIRNGKTDPSINLKTSDLHNEENLRPKGENNGVDRVDLQNITALYAAGQFPQPFMQFDPTASHLSQYVAAQMTQINGARSFLPYAYPTTLLNSMLPGLTGNAYNFGVRGEKEQKLDAKLFEALQAQQDKKSDKDKQSTDKEEEEKDKLLKEELADVSKTDENQNNETSRDHLDDSRASNKDGEDEDEPKKDDSNHDEEEDATESGDDSKSEKKENGDMAAVKQILQTIDATVNHQQQEKDDKSAISRLGPEEERHADEDAANMTCRYCKTTFNSPVELHQHERYLCKQNQEIQSGRGGKTNGDVSPAREVVAVPEPKLEDDAASEASSSNEREGRQYHVRSWFSEDQRSTLREHYKSNPRPDKLELTQLALQLGLPKRVVQVWFQNTRAQDRRKGIPIPPASATKGGNSSSCWSSNSSIATKVPSTPYIPIVPQVPFNSVPTTMYYASKANGAVSNGHSSHVSNGQIGHITTTANLTSSPLSSLTFSSSPSVAAATSSFNMQMEPLDLSVKKTESPCGARLSSDENEDVNDAGVLNLSKKASCSDSIKDSAIVKVMQQEGLIIAEDHISSHSNSSTPAPPRSREMTPVASPHSQDLVVYPQGSPYLSPSRDSSDMASPPNSLESSFNSTFSLDSASKRSRKKSWRQVSGYMESEEVTMDTEDDSLLIDEDEPSRKKRKSWKQHKLDCEEGIYACDQCDKMFNKQSSLARHKYEHSGQRPFACDMCTKAFKHKHHLTEHKRLHSGEKPFQCRKCGKRFSHSGSYSQHMNHRYKYCKPLVNGQDDDDEETEESVN